MRLALVALTLLACSPADVLQSQGQTLRSTDYVQVAIDKKKKEDAEKAEAERRRQAAAQDIQAHADAGQRHMDLFEYDAAIAEFRQAYLASSDPIYLEKIGDAHRATGNCVDAQDMYTQYLAKRKDAPDAKAVQARLEEAKGCQTRAGSNIDEIRKRYRDGATHYDLGEYPQAVTDFKEAYRLSNDPAYLFNIAQAYRMSKSCGEARRFYERYLSVAPDAPNKEKIQGMIEEMKGCAK